MSNIVEARKQLIAISDELDIIGNNFLSEQIRRIVKSKLTRRPPVRRVGNKSRKLTPSIKLSIKHLAETTDLPAHEIAAQLGVNPGRVSEVLQGDR